MGRTERICQPEKTDMLCEAERLLPESCVNKAITLRLLETVKSSSLENLLS